MHKSPPVVYAGAYVGARGSQFPAHRHSCWELVYYRRGRALAPIGDLVCDAHPGVLLATPPDTVHSERAVTAYENHHVGLDAPADHPWPVRADDDADQSLGRLMAALVREHAESRHDDGLIELLAAELDLQLRRAGRREHPPVEPAIAHARRLLDEGYASGLRVTDVARQVGLSPSALRRKFASTHGVSPREYLHSVRLRHAPDHLRHSSLTLDTIARLAGYHSASHLARHVKAATGLAPGRLRRDARSGA
jgi:AraC-like DNA-binding protein